MFILWSVRLWLVLIKYISVMKQRRIRTFRVFTAFDNFIFCIVTPCILVGGYQTVTREKLIPLSAVPTAATSEAEARYMKFGTQVRGTPTCIYDI